LPLTDRPTTFFVETRSGVKQHKELRFPDPPPTATDRSATAPPPPPPAKKKRKRGENPAGKDDDASGSSNSAPARRSVRFRPQTSYAEFDDYDSDDYDDTTAAASPKRVPEEAGDDPEYDAAVKEEEDDDDAALAALASAAAAPVVDVDLDVDEKPDVKPHVDVSYTGFSIFGKTLVCMYVPPSALLIPSLGNVKFRRNRVEPWPPLAADSTPAPTGEIRQLSSEPSSSSSRAGSTRPRSVSATATPVPLPSPSRRQRTPLFRSMTPDEMATDDDGGAALLSLRERSMSIALDLDDDSADGVGGKAQTRASSVAAQEASEFAVPSVPASTVRAGSALSRASNLRGVGSVPSQPSVKDYYTT
jgi:hypothetical protein